MDTIICPACGNEHNSTDYINNELGTKLINCTGCTVTFLCVYRADINYIESLIF